MNYPLRIIWVNFGKNKISRKKKKVFKFRIKKCGLIRGKKSVEKNLKRVADKVYTDCGCCLLIELNYFNRVASEITTFEISLWYQYCQ